jgi:hypothetical protein
MDLIELSASDMNLLSMDYQNQNEFDTENVLRAIIETIRAQEYMIGYLREANGTI